MADKKKYYIRVPEACVEVSEDVYKAFWSMDRHIRTLEEKDARKIARRIAAETKADMCRERPQRNHYSGEAGA